MRKSTRGKQRFSLVSFLKARAFAVSGLLLIACIFAGSYFLRIKQVTALVDGEHIHQLSTSLSFLLHQSLFYTNLEQTALFTDTLKNDQGQIFLPERVEKKLPNEIVIHFIQEDPLYRLLWKDKLYSVNSKNFLAEDSPKDELMTVTVSSNYHSQIQHNQIDPGLNQRIQNLIQALQEREIHPDKIFLDASESYLIFKDNKYIFEEQAEKQLAAFKISIIHSNLSNLNIDAGAINYIDLRFDLPVINSSRQLDAIQQAQDETGEIELETEGLLDEVNQIESIEIDQEDSAESLELLELESADAADDQAGSEETNIDTPTFIE